MAKGIPPQVKATVDRCAVFVSPCGDAARDKAAFDGLKQALGQLDWLLDDTNVKGSARITSKSSTARASGAVEHCVNPDVNPRAIRAYGVLCKLDAYRRDSLCKLTDYEGNKIIDTEIVFNAQALPTPVREYLETFAAVSSHP